MVFSNKIKTFNLGLLSKYRTTLMGIAAIFIILCHIPQYGVEVHHTLRSILIYGNIGVDIFLFLSGLGCYYSLSKNTKLSIWYKKRFFRIFIPYTLIQIPFWLYYIILGNFNILNEFIIYSTIVFWIWHLGAWYIALLIPLYLLTPFIYKVLHNKKYILLKTIAIIVFLVIMCNISIENIHNKPLYEFLKNIQWAFSRIPSFIIGISIAPLINKNIKVNTTFILISSLTLYIIIHLIDATIFAWWCLVPTILIIMVILFEYIKLDIISKFIYWMGTVSLESYLANIYLCKLIKDTVNRIGDKIIFNGHYIEYLCIILLGILISRICNKFSLSIIKKINF